MKSLIFFCFAAFFEIAGCFSFWLWIRQQRTVWWLVPGVVSLILFAYLLTRVEASFAGRAYAAYGGIYISASLLWLLIVEGVAPDRYDLIGAFVCLTGAGIILWAPR